MACGFVFVVNPGAQTFHAVQDAPTEVPERARHRQIKRVCDHVLAQGAGTGGTHLVLEVGAGWGGLAQVFSRDGRYRYVGFEPSASRAAYCRARGFDVREGLFGGRESAGAADAVILDNVLEHVENPEALVREAIASLSEGGVLIVIVPNLNDIRRIHRPWRERHYWQPHCHINYFSARDLEQLFRRNGLGRRFFGLEAVSRTGDDIGLLPRVLADMAGLHVLGLNCYGVKSGSA
ncbi:MAG: class I SAM-dependent methyltransferase [Steroidobacteraceae bacterium]